MPAFFLPSIQSLYWRLPSLNLSGIPVADSNFHSLLQKNPNCVQ